LRSGYLFTPVCLCHQAVQFGIGQGGGRSLWLGNRWKVTAEYNQVYDQVTAKKPGSVPTPMPVIEYGTTFLPGWVGTKHSRSNERISTSSFQQNLTDQLFQPHSIQGICLAYAKLFQIFINHLQPYYHWSTLTIRPTESWIFHTFL